MRRIACSLAALALLAGPSTAAAQTAAERTPAVEEGARVRFLPGLTVSRSRWIEGTVVSASADSLTLLRAGGREHVSVHRGEIYSLQVSAGHRSTGPSLARSVGLGALVGATAGTALGVAAYEADRGQGLLIMRRRDVAAIGAVALGAVGAAVGGLVGWQNRGEQWADVPARPGPSVAVRPDGGVGVSLSLRF